MAEIRHGRFFEDFEVGAVYRSRQGRTLSEADNTWFTLVTNNPNQIHFNTVYAERTEFGRCLINSALTLAIVAGLTVEDVSENGINLGWGYIRIPHPVFAGDTLFAETEVLEARPSSSRPAFGIVRVETRGINQDAVRVMEFERSIMVWKRDAAPARSVFPSGVG